VSKPQTIERRVRRLQATLAGFSVLGAVGIHLVGQAGMMLRWPGWHPSMFRNYYWSDQLAYLSIATNAAHGDLSAVEPLTLTGSNYYPRAHYLLIGVLARLTSTSAATMWTVLGLLAQCLLVAAVGAACVLLTRRWWAGFFGFVPFVLGTFSWFVSKSWMTTMDSHAVLWGPFGVLYTLNGESVALCLAGVALLGLVVVGASRVPARAVWPVALAACFVVGFLANIQTYSFLVSTFLLAGGAAAVGLTRAPSRRGMASTLGLLAVVVVAGPVVREQVGPLAALALGLLPAVPGLLTLARSTSWRVAWGAVAVGLGASPQIGATLLGLANNDPFLTYRESSSQGLGVPWATGLVAAGAVLPAIAFVIVVGWRTRRTLWIALPSAGAVVWALLALNDHWGANQEPYRFWLDTYVLVATVLVPLVAWVAVDTWTRRQSPAGPVDVDPRGLGRTGRLVAVAALVVVVAFAGASSIDWLHFRRDVSSAGYLKLSTPRYVEAADIASAAGDGLVLTDLCLDPLFFKVNWGGAVAGFNRGLAWPDHVEALDAVLHARATGLVDEAAARTANVRWLITSTACAPAIVVPAGAERVASGEYGADGADPAGTVALWRLAP
jgi:hypothetical protein